MFTLHVFHRWALDLPFRKLDLLVFTAVLQMPLGALCGAGTADAFILARDGKPAATIIVAKGAAAAADFAAAELQEHVRKITGATLPIVTDEAPAEGRRILVGESAATRALKVGTALKPQECLITFLPDTLVLMGRDAQPDDPAAAAVRPQRAGGKFGGALKFDGVKTALSVPDCPFDDAAGSLEAWVWLPAAAPAKPGTILRLDGQTPWTYHILQRDPKSGVISYTTYDGKRGYGVRSGPLPEGWHHLLATYDAEAEKMELHVDGKLAGAAKYVRTTCKGASLKIGGVKADGLHDASNLFEGLIDEARISKRVRAATPGSPQTPCAPDPDTVALFHFDETAGQPHNSATARHTATPPGFFEERGSLDAVYDFLERFCGVRWYAPTELGLVCPSSPTLAVRGRDILRAPAMDYLWLASSPLYLPAPPDKVPAHEVTLWKLRMRLGGQPFSGNHSFYGYYDRFLKEHPDWFAQGHAGKPPQMCYTHPGFIRQVVQDARDYFDGKGKHPGAVAMGDLFSLGPMDNSQYCTCPRCQPLFDAGERDNPQFTGGYASAYIFGFVNAVASEVRKTHPGKWVGTLAYSKYGYCPPAVRLEPNIKVQLCLHTRNWWCPSMEANDRKTLAGWRSQDPERPIYLWLYYCFPALSANFGKFHYFPGFFAHRVVDQMRLFHKTKIRGIFLEHSSECGATYLMDQLELYLTFKLADDPDLDGEALIAEFFTRYYGAAAAPMKALYLAIEDAYSNPACYPEAIRTSPAHQHQTAQLAWDSLGMPERMAHYARLMGQARAAAETPAEKARVALFEKGIWDYMVEGRKRHDTRAASPEQK